MTLKSLAAFTIAAAALLLETPAARPQNYPERP
jgi:hypothetical protein